MKIIADLTKKTLKMLENERSIFRGEYGADKLELYMNKTLENEYPTITALLSNGRKIGPYTTDDAYSTEVIDDVTYTKASFTLSKENGFTLSEGKMQITIWINNSNGRKEAIGNVTLNVINTTAFDDGDIIVSGDVEGTIVNYRVELENLQSQINKSNVAFNGRISTLENKTKKYFDLGEITQSPTIQNNTKLNSIKENGIYTFSYNKQQYFMMVSDVFADGSDIVYTILKQGQEELYIVIRELVDHSMYITEHIVATLEDLKGKADTQYVDVAVEELLRAIEQNADEINALKNNIESISIVKADKTEIPVNLSQLKNDTKFITDTVSNLKNYYNKNEVNELIGQASSLKFEVVTTLPTSNISSSTIYLKKIGTEGTNIYEEYLYVNNRWEMIGNTSVDLSNYVQKDELMEVVTENSKEAVELELKEVESEYEIVESNKYLTPNDRQVPTTSVVDKIVNSKVTPLESAVSGNSSKITSLEEETADHETRITTLESGGGGSGLWREVTFTELKTFIQNNNLKEIYIINDTSIPNDTSITSYSSPIIPIINNRCLATTVIATNFIALNKIYFIKFFATTKTCRIEVQTYNIINNEGSFSLEKTTTSVWDSDDTSNPPSKLHFYVKD